MKSRPRPVQLFSDEYLATCRRMRPEETIEYLEGFRLLHEGDYKASRLISLKVPADLLEAFRRRCGLEGVRYQTQLKRLMSDWLRVDPPRP